MIAALFVLYYGFELRHDDGCTVAYTEGSAIALQLIK
jgi:hypothetical protein